MKTIFYLLLILSPLWLWSQSANRSIRQGVKAFQQGNFTEAQGYFEEAVKADPTQFAPVFNQGDAWYEMDSVSRAAEAFQTAIAKAEDKAAKAQAFHNLGNTFLKAQQYEQSVQAFQQALLHNPKDEESRYNLAYAMTKLQEQQQQNQDQENNQDQNEEQEQDKEQQEKQDQSDQEKENEEQQNQQDQQEQQQQNDQQQEQEKQEQQQQISKQQAEQILQALEKEEQKIQQKLNKKAEVKTEKKEKDW